MFLRQNFIFCRLRLWGSGVWGAVWGSLLSCCCLQVFKRLRWLYFKVVRISAKKARIQKNVMLYNFFTFLFERSRADHELISWVFRRWWACKRLQGLYITPFFAVFRWLPNLGELSSVIFGLFSVLPAVLRLVVGLILSSCEKVGLYMYVLFSVYSILK